MSARNGRFRKHLVELQVVLKVRGIPVWRVVQLNDVEKLRFENIIDIGFSVIRDDASFRERI
jgi:hypothetical protein